MQISLLIQTRPLFHWRKRYYGLCTHIFNQKQWFEVKNVLMLDLFQLLSSQDVNWWTGVLWITCGLLFCFYQLFDSHSDGTHSLQSIHCWDTDAMLHFSKSDEETNSSTSWMIWRWSHFQQSFIFGWTFPLNFHTQAYLVEYILPYGFTVNLMFTDKTGSSRKGT